jgi:hypothetical protein
MVDPTTLQSQAETLLGILEDKAADAGWEPARHCVTPGPVAVECDSIFVWADAITPIKDQAGEGCHVVLRTRFQYVVAICVGVEVGCDKWTVSSSAMHDTVWGVQAGFVQAVLAKELCGSPCSVVRFGDFILVTNDGGFSWWQGSVQIDLSPEELAS